MLLGTCTLFQNKEQKRLRLRLKQKPLEPTNQRRKRGGSRLSLDRRISGLNPRNSNGPVLKVGKVRLDLRVGSFQRRGVMHKKYSPDQVIF